MPNIKKANKHNFRYRIRLKSIHDKSGENIYEIAEKLGISKNTARRYVEQDEALVAKPDNALLALIHHYGAEFHEVVDYVIVDDEPRGQNKTPLAASA